METSGAVNSSANKKPDLGSDRRESSKQDARQETLPGPVEVSYHRYYNAYLLKTDGQPYPHHLMCHYFYFAHLLHLSLEYLPLSRL